MIYHILLVRYCRFNAPDIGNFDTINHQLICLILISILVIYDSYFICPILTTPHIGDVDTINYQLICPILNIDKFWYFNLVQIYGKNGGMQFIFIDGCKISNYDWFYFSGSIIRHNGDSDEIVAHRITSAWFSNEAYLEYCVLKYPRHRM